MIAELEKFEPREEKPYPSLAEVRGLVPEFEQFDPPPTYRQVRGWEEDWEKFLPQPPTYQEVLEQNAAREDGETEEEEPEAKREQIFVSHKAILYGAKIVSEENVHDFPYHSYITSEAMHQQIVSNTLLKKMHT